MDRNDDNVSPAKISKKLVRRSLHAVVFNALDSDITVS